MSAVPFALQLYTVRDHIEKDTPGTLRRVREAGYAHVELAGFGKFSPVEWKRMLSDAELTAVSGHFGLDEATTRIPQTIEALETLGIAHVVIPAARAESKAGWLDIAQRLDEAGSHYHAHGYQLCYHNHAHEFEQFDGQYALDVLLAATEVQNLALQLDLYWAKKGGVDPAAYVLKYTGRVPLVHAKDMTAEEPHTFAECGRGIQDWPAIFAAGAKAGIQWYIVEQDTCPVDSLESARISAEFMAKQTLPAVPRASS